MRILIIDDEMEVLTLFKDILESVGHAVDIAIDGETGLEMVAAHEYDLVVMDYRMHGKDGIQVAEEIWAMDDVKILFASADPTIREEALEKGAVGFLHKPFDLDEMVEEVERYG